jgi:hypothetical protein
MHLNDFMIRGKDLPQRTRGNDGVFMDSSLPANAPDLIWLPLVFVLFGAGLATAVVRRLRLPACFWLALVFGATAITSYLDFYVWFFSPSLGRQVSLATLIVSALALAWQCRDESVRRLLTQRDVWLPGLLTLLVMLAYLCVLAWPRTLANYRFDLHLPPEDNIVPRVLADRFEWGFYRHETPPPIMWPGYRSSDRPPVQAGIVLALRPWQISSTSWTYEIIGLLCQLGWIPALYALARTIGVDRRGMIVILIGCATSGFFFLNSIYVWPKFLAATLFLTGLTLLLHVRQRPHARRRAGESASSDTGAHTPHALMIVIAGTLFGLALLAHGGPFFSVIALPVLVMMLRPWPRVSIGALLGAVLIPSLLLVPWLVYQRFYDPPGDRLVKMHLAGLEPNDDKDTRSVWRALRDQYRALTLRGYLAGRWSNVTEQFLVFGKAPPLGWVFWLQWQQFFHQLPALDTLLIGCVAFVLPRRSRISDERARLLRSILVYTVAATAIWIVLMLAPNSAMIHQGSYATTALLFFCAGAYLAQLPNAVVIGALAVHVVFSARVWAAWPRDVALSAGMQQPNALYLCAAALFLTAFACCLRMIPEV